MAKVSVDIWYNLNGEIVAVGRAMGEQKVVALAGEYRLLKQTMEDGDLASLHATHSIAEDSSGSVYLSEKTAR